MSKVVISGGSIEEIGQKVTTEVKKQMASRSYRVANALRNSALDVLKGQRGGRVYRVPGTKRYYTASAPGEPPAVRTGTFRNSWQPKTYAGFNSFISRIESGVEYAKYLEDGTPGGQMAPRPHHERIAKKTEPEMFRIYNEPYF